MSNRWLRVRLGDILRRSTETIDILADTEYRQITLKLWGKGAVLRGVLTGAQIAARRQTVARYNQFLVSRIDARNGALGVVPRELDGAVVSNDFPTFDLATDRILPEFLGWMCKAQTFVQECQRASEGTTNRVRLQEEAFLRSEISLPPLAEQRRLVAQIEHLGLRIAEATKVRDDGMRAADTLLYSQATRLLERLEQEYRTELLLDLCDFQGGSQPPKTTFRYEPTPGYVRFLQIRDFSSDRYATFIPESSRNSLVAEHEILVGRYGASLGKILRGKRGAYNVAMCKAAPRRSDIEHDFLASVLRFGQFQQRLSEISRSAQAGFNKADLKGILMPVPPLSEQRKIAAYIDKLEERALVLRSIQAETSAELDALMPSILDRAFRGEL